MPGAVKETPHATTIWKGTERHIECDLMGPVGSPVMDDMAQMNTKISHLVEKDCYPRIASTADNRLSLQVFRGGNRQAVFRMLGVVATTSSFQSLQNSKPIRMREERTTRARPQENMEEHLG
jgi:hypothetical protein